MLGAVGGGRRLRSLGAVEGGRRLRVLGAAKGGRGWVLGAVEGGRRLRMLGAVEGGRRLRMLGAVGGGRRLGMLGTVEGGRSCTTRNVTVVLGMFEPCCARRNVTVARSTLESAATDARIGGRGGEKEKKEKEDRSRIRPTIAPILQGGHGHTGPAGQDTLTHHCVVVLVAMPSAFVVYVYAPCALLLVVLSAVRLVGYLVLCARLRCLVPDM